MIGLKALWLGLPKAVRLILPVLTIAILILVLLIALSRSIERLGDIRHQAGIEAVRAETQAEILKRVEQSHAVGSQIKREADAGRGQLLYDVCLQSARTPENCKRFLSAGQTDND